MSHAGVATIGRLTVLMHMQRHLLFILLSLPMLPACDDNVDASYKGEPLVSLSGKILAPATVPAGDLVVVLAWQRFATDGDYLAAEAVEVGGSFPAAFDLDVYTPPAEAALNHFVAGDAGVAIGVILAVPAEPDLDMLGEGTLEGVVESHVLAYAAADIAGDTPLGAFVGGPLTAGFHLLQLTPATAEEVADYEACTQQDDNSGCEYPFDRLTPAPIDASLNLVLGKLEALNVPNFT